MRIREFCVGDEMALHEVFYSAVHQLAYQHYAVDQINAWAPPSVDQEGWSQRMRGLRPFVVEDAGTIVGYADVQSSGHIEHFFVSGAHARRGIGTMLMDRIHQAAHMQGIKVLDSNVSRTAQPFFQRCGFILVEQRAPVIRGVIVPNAFMRKELLAVARQEHRHDVGVKELG